MHIKMLMLVKASVMLVGWKNCFTTVILIKSIFIVKIIHLYFIQWDIQFSHCLWVFYKLCELYSENKWIICFKSA